MQRRPHPLLPILIGLSVGCSGPQHVAKYGWLRNQGAVQEQLARDGAKTAPTADFEWENPGLEPITWSEVDGSGTESAAATILPLGSPRYLGNAPQGPGRILIELTSGTAAIPHAPLPVQDTTSYYAPEKHRWNAKAIASLPIAIGTVVMGIASQSLFILLAGGVVAFVLGLVSARQCRDRGDRGKGFALTAMILGAAAMFLSLMVIIWAA